jgi:hypothetical protein
MKQVSRRPKLVSALRAEAFKGGLNCFKRSAGF